MNNRFRECRKAMGMTMKEAGNKLGISESTVSLYETNKHDPDITMIKKMAGLYRVTVGYLLGENEPTTQNEQRLDETLVTLLASLNEAQTQRVRDFIAGIIAGQSE